MTKRATIFVTVTCATILLAVSSAGADSLRTIVERGMIAPGSEREFLNFGQLNGLGPAISGENVAFAGITNGGGGYYASFDGTIVVLADTEMTIPGTEETFSFPLAGGSDPSISGRRVAFFGNSSLGPKLFVWNEGDLKLIAATNVTIVPGTEDVTFRNFGTLEGASPSISGENVTFASLLNSFQPDSRPGGDNKDHSGENSEEQGTFAAGVYAYINGELRVIVDTNTVVPGEDVAFSRFDVVFGVSPSISGENVAFGARWPKPDGNEWLGIWAYIDGSLELVARRGDPKPGGGTFGAFRFVDGFSPSISGENVVFNDGAAIFARIDGELRLIANSDSDPGASTQQIVPSTFPRISGENVVFAAANPSGIYAHIDGILKRFVDTSTMIPGHDVPFFGNIAGVEPSISGNNIAFSGGGIGTNGVYLLTPGPPPPTPPPLPPPVPGQSDWSVISVTLVLLAVASAIIVRRLLSPARRSA